MRTSTALVLAAGCLLGACNGRSLDGRSPTAATAVTGAVAGVQRYFPARHAGVVLGERDLHAELVVEPEGRVLVYPATEEGASQGTSPSGVILQRATDGTLSRGELRWDGELGALSAELPAPVASGTEYEVDVTAGAARLRAGAVVSAGGTLPTRLALRALGEVPGNDSPALSGDRGEPRRRRSIGGGPVSVETTSGRADIDAGLP